MAVSKGYLSTTLSAQPTGKPTHSTGMRQIASRSDDYRRHRYVSKLIPCCNGSEYVPEHNTERANAWRIHTRWACVSLLPEVSTVRGNASSLHARTHAQTTVRRLNQFSVWHGTPRCFMYALVWKPRRMVKLNLGSSKAKLISNYSHGWGIKMSLSPVILLSDFFMLIRKRWRRAGC